MYVVQREIDNQVLSIKTKDIAELADSSVLVQYGDTIVLVTVTVSKQINEEISFFPLVVEYRERAYAAGKIPGGFYKREGKPSEKEITTSRMIDRFIRPLFPSGFRNEIQIIALVLSSDTENESDILAMLGTSAALSISQIPFNGPVGIVRIGRINNKFIINPTNSELKESDLDIVLAGKEKKIVMIECSAKEVKEEDILAAISFGEGVIQATIEMQNELISLCGKKKEEFKLKQYDEQIIKTIREKWGEKLLNANYDPDKLKRREKVSLVKNEIIESFPNNNKQEIEEIVNIIEAEVVRKKIIETGERPDGRMPEDLRPISCSIGVLPRTHGSAIFTRGQTQTLVVTTLGTSEDVQILDELEGYTKKRFMFHYNFPPFSVGETTPMKGPTRREIGHGSLAERAVLPLIPSEDKFPYVIQIVSDILSSNGSSSMASVCGASLSLMDAGIPIKTHVAGISVGLIKENEKYRILTDIQGLEDHFGDMDFKIAGTKYGITAIQLDMKIDGLELNILEEAMYQSKKARDVILDILNKTISSPRPNLSEYAPRIVTIHINPAKIKDVIGPAGKNIKKIIEEFNVTIDISPDGKIKIASNNPESSAKAISAIKEIAQEPEIGKIYFGKVIRVADYGAFVEIFPGTVGLVHISQIIDGRVRRVSDYLREGDEVFVKVIDIDENNRIRLSYKQAVAEMKLNEKDSFRKTKRGI